MADSAILANTADRRAQEWRIILEESRSGPMNMALDEVAAATAANGGPRTVRVYAWEPSTLSMGYSQAEDTVDWEYCESEGITVTRRPTGGGGIYHDGHGDVSYSIIAPKGELPGELMTSYHLLCTPILEAFHRVGIGVDYTDAEAEAVYEPACYLRERHPAHDMVAPDGRKIAGNAQYRQRDSVIQHGSLTYATMPDRHLACFDGHELTTDAFEESVTGVTDHADVTRMEFVSAVEEKLTEWCSATAGGWFGEELSAARDLAESKYEAVAWVRSGDDPS